jgi:YfiH family protein
LTTISAVDPTEEPPTISSSFVTRSALLSSVQGVRHGLTGRVPRLGLADGNVAYSAPRDQIDAWEMRRAWCAAIGVDPERLATLGQVHGSDVHVATAEHAGRGARPGSGRVGLGDALLTADPGVALMTLHADCVPIFLVDPDRPAIATVHAGWRGTVADVAGESVRAMAQAFGTRPSRLLAYLGPAIGPCCYVVGDDVAAAWGASGPTAPGSLLRAGERWRFDLRAANLNWLRRAGLDPDRCETSAVCTRCHGDRWFSHRGQGPETGRFGAVIALVD